MSQPTPTPTPSTPQTLNFNNYHTVRPGRRSCGCGR